jgi:hypothetical protein
MLAPHLYSANVDTWSVGGMPCTHTHTHTHTHAFAQPERAAEYLEAQQETLPTCAEHRYTSYCLLKGMCLKCPQPV